MPDLSSNRVKNNRYDNLLLLFLSLLILGGIGGALQPIRIFVILCAPFTFNHFLKNGREIFNYRYEFLLFSFWILYGLITLFWSFIPQACIKETLYLVLNFFAFFTVIYFANKASNPQDSIIKGWLILFILTLPVALYELWFDVHLGISYLDKGLVMKIGTQVLNRKFASVTYGNLNGYNTLLCYMLPFILGFSVKSLSKIKTLFIWLIIFCLSYIIVMNGSRGAALCLLLGYSVFALFYLKRKSILIILSFVVLISIYISIHYSEIFTIIAKRFAVLGLHDPERAKILSSGWDALVKSRMFGVGGGNFMPIMDSVYHLKITAPHNLFLEIGVQYGLLIIFLFLGMILRLFLKQYVNHNKTSKFITLSALAMFPLTSVIDSGYILGIEIWLFLASLYVIADKKFNKSIE